MFSFLCGGGKCSQQFQDIGVRVFLYAGKCDARHKDPVCPKPAEKPYYAY